MALRKLTTLKLITLAKLIKLATGRKSFQVEIPSKAQKNFVPDGCRFYFIDDSASFGAGHSNAVFGNEVIKTEDCLTQIIQTGQDMIHIEHAIATIPGRPKKFSKQDTTTANVVRHFQHVNDCSSDATLMTMATKQTTWNCPFTSRDVKITTKILDPSMHYGLKGKRVRKTKDPVQTEDLVPIPKTINEH